MQNTKKKKNHLKNSQENRTNKNQRGTWVNISYGFGSLSRPIFEPRLHQTTTSKTFVFLLSCALKQRLRGDALDDCITHI